MGKPFTLVLCISFMLPMQCERITSELQKNRFMIIIHCHKNVEYGGMPLQGLQLLLHMKSENVAIIQKRNLWTTATPSSCKCAIAKSSSVLSSTPLAVLRPNNFFNWGIIHKTLLQVVGLQLPFAWLSMLTTKSRRSWKTSLCFGIKSCGAFNAATAAFARWSWGLKLIAFAAYPSL